MNLNQLQATADLLVKPGKGILAADESLPTIEKRFRRVGISATAENRHAYRQMLITTPGLGQFISGVILFDETIRQKDAAGTPFVDLLKHERIIPGIKVDHGAKAFAGFPGEKITEGLDGLRERLAEYGHLGARFAKWRAVIALDATRPSRTCLLANAYALARFAALSQEAGLVPVVEPEILMDGDHALERHAEVTETTLRAVFQALGEHRVYLEGLLLKTNMILPGTTCPLQATVDQVAQATAQSMLRTVPAAVQGIVFLSGGQTDVAATEHLAALNHLGKFPWELSFSFGRALQTSALEAWKGLPENIGAAQKALFHRARCNAAARFGTRLDGWKDEATKAPVQNAN